MITAIFCVLIAILVAAGIATVAMKPTSPLHLMIGVAFVMLAFFLGCLLGAIEG